MFKIVKKSMLVLLALTVLFITGCTEEGFVADKVNVLGVDIGQMSREEAIEALGVLELDGDVAVTMKVGDESYVLVASQVGAKYNAEKTVDYIMENHNGIFSGWFEKSFSMQVEVDSSLLSDALVHIETEGSPAVAKVTEEGIEVTNKILPKHFDREELTGKLSEAFGSGVGEIEIEFIVGEIESSDDVVFSLIDSELCESEYIMNEDGTIYVTESVPGVELDKAEAEKVMAEHTGEGEVYLIPCKIEMPVRTKEELEAALFRDTLASYKTNFSSSSANRASNINLASNTINGTVLMPGEVFSFNDTLGERTIARGYKSAGAYVAGKTVDQVGGGICQVSSTLYNSVLLSNLEIVERRSHQMTVSYVPMGRDATVNWGTTDFRFKNNTDYPVKIVATIQGRNVTFSIVGTKTYEDMKVEILTNTVSVIEPGMEYVEDPEQEVGYSKVENGSRGYVVDAVRVVYSQGVEVERENLTRSRYNPKNAVTTVGTKVVEIPTDSYVVPPVVENVAPMAGELSDTGM